MKTRFGVTALTLITLLFLPIVNTAISADKMTYEEYQSQLVQFQARENDANDKIESERSEIEKIKSNISDIGQQIVDLWNEIYSFANTSKDGFEQLTNRINAHGDKISEFERLSPDALLDRANELDDLDAMISELRGENGSILSGAFDELEDLAQRVERLRNAVPKPKHDMYSVVRGDHLWRIAGKSSIFNDPWKWMRIYSSNRSQIKDPDLIFPDQRLRIPRQIGREEYLVKTGIDEPA